ncbi:MAG TPA: signal peptidase II [Thermoanaerobaculia bacterium]|nr:signal peptidase II [Thermoanaerobaculia bacterium]
MRRIATFFAVLLIVVGIDQGTKMLVRAYVGPPRSFAAGALMLLHTENTGAFLSLGADLPSWAKSLIFGGVVAVLLVMFTAAVIKGTIHRTGETIASAAVIGGGLGNLLDRAFRSGHVTDFLYLQLGPLHTGIFNAADMAITAGVIWLIFTMQRATKPISAS